MRNRRQEYVIATVRPMTSRQPEYGVTNPRAEPPDQHAAFIVRQNRYGRLRVKIRNNRNSRLLLT